MALITSCLLRRWRRLYSAWHCARSSVRQFCTADEEKYLELLQLKDIKRFGTQVRLRGFIALRHFVCVVKSFMIYKLRSEDIFITLICRSVTTKLKSLLVCYLRTSVPGKYTAEEHRNVAQKYQVRPNGIAQSESTDEDAFLEYPFRSPCGKEINFIKCADRPFVFEDLRRDDSGNWMLIFGGGELMMPFLPETLRVSLMTGRLYHDVQTKYIARGTREGVALVKSQLAVELSKHMDFNDFPNGTDADVKSLQVGDFKWENQHYAIHTIE
ncbi:hypothetical protein PsorP6_008925 [Peronosclerospora sorghi]|uniref:Uncharacterized protein n=1 Tax=Peronosclerospora sorghi TaxID=230839 RepID=A0ACC0W075_9STRA|nr:hypothetical protein PsorP6_008925 [Peronosclerospora sorghi]